MKIVGLTGGIGSGKTTVAKVFECMGVPVFNSDIEARKILESGEMKGDLEREFGAVVFTNGEVDRKKLAQEVFTNDQKLEALNALIHPRVASVFKAWKNTNSKASFLIKEAAILIESGAYQTVDEIIVVSAPKDLRIERVASRDGRTREEIEAIISKQLPQEELLSYAQFEVKNDGRLIVPQIVEIFNQLQH